MNVTQTNQAANKAKAMGKRGGDYAIPHNIYTRVVAAPGLASDVDLLA